MGEEREYSKFESFRICFFFILFGKKYSSDKTNHKLKEKEICFNQDALVLDRAKLKRKLVCCGWGDEHTARERERERGVCFSIMAFTFFLVLFL